MKKIYINPGHSNTDPGAVGYETERTLNVKVSNFMNEYLLKNYDCETRMNPGTMGSSSTIAQDANAWGADLFVSNHFNAGGGDGYEALVYSSKRQALGQIFEKHVKAIGQNSRGVKLRPDLTVLRLTNMPAVLNEGAFVDTKKDIEDWNDDHELKKLGIAYAEAAAEYLGLSKKVVKEETSVSTPTSSGAKTATVTLNVLQKGNKNAQVKTLQRLLIAMGYNLGTSGADGDFGNNTDSAVRRFQSNNGLVSDGIVGNSTWGKLLKG